MPTSFCVQCSAQIPETKRVGLKSQYSSFFCGIRCYEKYSDALIGMFRTSELEAEKEMDSEGFIGRFVTDIDEAAASAVSKGFTPQEIAARFIASVAGKFAKKMYTAVEEKARQWVAAQNETAEADGEAEPPSPEAKPQAKPQAKTKAAPPPEKPQESRRVHPPQTDQDSKPQGKEPKNLLDLSISEQRVWLVKRFKKLHPGATSDEIKTEFLRLTKILHPDNKRTGNCEKMAFLNTTFDRIKQIDTLMAKAQEKKMRRQKSKAS